MFTYKESVIKKTGSKIDVGLLRKIYRILYRRQNKKKISNLTKKILNNGGKLCASNSLIHGSFT